MNPEEDRRPEWAFWLLVPTVTPFEAVALSMDVDPKWLVEPDGRRRSGLAWVMFPPAGFIYCLELTRRCIGETLPPAQSRHGEDRVALRAFTRWALDLGWDLPVEMRELVDNNIVSTRSGDGDEPGPPTAHPTVAAETKCQKWLSELMIAGPKTMTRDEYEAAGRERFRVGPRAWGRAWANAIKETGKIEWSNSGRRKSKHRTDTPI
jgi:hypothetical protein